MNQYEFGGQSVDEDYLHTELARELERRKLLIDDGFPRSPESISVMVEEVRGYLAAIVHLVGDLTVTGPLRLSEMGDALYYGVDVVMQRYPGVPGTEATDSPGFAYCYCTKSDPPYVDVALDDPVWHDEWRSEGIQAETDAAAHQARFPDHSPSWCPCRRDEFESAVSQLEFSAREMRQAWVEDLSRTT